MSRYEVKCVKKTPPGNKHEHIFEIGNRMVNPAWQFSVSDVIQMINNGHTFVVKDKMYPTIEAVVRPFPDRVKGPYIRSMPDGSTTDNLLSLPPCP